MTDGPRADATFLDALAAALDRQRRPGIAWNNDIETAPVAVLWADPGSDFAPYLPALGADRPIYTLGPFDPARQTGPAYWIRYELDRLADPAVGTIADPGDTPDEPGATPAPAIPVVYLPGYGRDAFHDAGSCPAALRPLFALRHAGRFWDAPRGLDWTLPSALKELAGARVQAGEKHLKATRDARLKLADVPVRALQAAAPLRDSWLLGLLIDDAPLALLRWLNDPAGARTAMGDGGWAALVDVAGGQYGVDLARLGPAEVAGRLAERQGTWAAVWRRFTENPGHWSGVADQLRQAHGLTPHQPGLLGGLAPAPARRSKAAGRSAVIGSFPQDTEEAEARLRADLTHVAGLPTAGARNAVAHAEAEHGHRREWVWAKLGQSPLAAAIKYLAALAEAVGHPAGGATVPDIVASYAGGGWRADDAMLRALAAVESTADRDAVAGAALALYRSWARDGANALQAAWRAAPPERPEPPVGLTPPGGTCVLFADGLRYDLGERLGEQLLAAGLTATVRPHLAALPTVTPTAKNAVAPVASLLGGGSGFDPTVAATGQKLAAPVLRTLLKANGWQVLAGSDVGEAVNGRAWTELGAIDSYGHGSGLDLARHAQHELDALVGRIRQLAGAGWRYVTVVTDHGWLLLPGGLPKNELNIHLTEDRKGRCARLKPGATPDQQVVPWHWDAGVGMAVAPDITCFEAGHTYDHGGLSPQEVVIPVVTVGTPSPSAVSPEIERVAWRGLRCLVTVSGPADGLRLQLRGAAADPTSALTAVVPVAVDADTRIVVVDESGTLESTLAWVVLLGPDGTVLHQRSTMVGTS